MSGTEYTPFKCPDCGVWWRTATHKCEPKSYLAPNTTTTTTPYTPAPKPDIKKGWLYCPICGKRVTKFDWHTCTPYDRLQEKHNEHKKKGYPHGPKDYPPTRWDT